MVGYHPLIRFKKMKALLVLLFASVQLVGISVRAQPHIGFWRVDKVEVGQETMTPVAKWFRINQDGTYQSGNGWLQNSVGTWTFDKAKNLYVPTEKNGIVDLFGGFEVGVKEE